jgi:hypothetical protein
MKEKCRIKFPLSLIEERKKTVTITRTINQMIECRVVEITAEN